MFILSTKMGENKKGTCVFVKIVRFWWILVRHIIELYKCIITSLHVYKKCLKYNYMLYNMINNIIISKMK